jgi:hypothetical protein
VPLKQIARQTGHSRALVRQVSRDNLDENGGGNLGVKRRPVATP